MGQLKLILATLVAIGAATHLSLLFYAPLRATDMQISAAIAKGAVWNTLTHNPVPKAGTTSVPLANPDSLTSRAFIDLKQGPFLLKGPVPENCVYWSVSLFSHNTDTIMILSDRDFPDGEVALGIGRSANDIRLYADHAALLKSDKGVLFIRCIMRDSTDKSYLEILEKERRKLQFAPLVSGTRI